MAAIPAAPRKPAAKVGAAPGEEVAGAAPPPVVPEAPSEPPVVGDAPPEPPV